MIDVFISVGAVALLFGGIGVVGTAAYKLVTGCSWKAAFRAMGW